MLRRGRRWGGSMSYQRVLLSLIDGQRFDDVAHSFWFEDDLRAITTGLFGKLGAELIDVHVLKG